VTNDNNKIDVFLAEVYSYNLTFKKPDQKFSINVVVRDEAVTRHIKNVLPVSNNIKQIPVMGENVLILLGYTEKSKTNGSSGADPIRRQRQWYYIPSPVNIRGSIKSNIGQQNSSDRLYPAASDPDFKTLHIKAAPSPLQPFLGDLLVEGRWGNSIRLGTTNKKNPILYSLEPNWKGKKEHHPLIILSNNTQGKGNDVFRVEKIKDDDSSLYLSTTQYFKDFKLGGSSPNPLKKFKIESKFDKPQLIGIADRIVLQAKKDIAVIDSPKAIVLNTKKYIKLGNDKADQPLPHGWVLYKILQLILNQLSTPIQVGSAFGTFRSLDSTRNAQKQLKQLLNKHIYITKDTF